MDIIGKILSMPDAAVAHWGYLLVLIVAILEAVPGIGIFVPGQTVVMIGGFLVRLGMLDFWYVFLFAFAGAIIGDMFSYYLGRKYGEGFISRYGRHFFFSKKHFAFTKGMMKSHTIKALILGRFTSLTRAFAPFVAGASGIRIFRVLLLVVIGSGMWAMFYTLLGYIFAESYQIAGRYIGSAIFIAIVLSILFIYAYRKLNRTLHIFAKYHLYALTLNIVSIYLFSKMVDDVVKGQLVTGIDAWISANVALIQGDVLNRMMILLTAVVSKTTFIILSVILLSYLIYRKRFYLPVLMVLSFAGGVLFEFLMKLLVQRARPETALVDVAGYSFPSGHATMAIIFFSFLLYSFKDSIRNRSLKALFIVGNVVIFLLVGFSRIYLNVHWFSDVIAGFALGMFWLTFLILVGKAIIELKKDHFSGFKRRFEKILPW